MADTAWMSTSRRLGLAGVSKYTARVLGPMAAATVSGRVKSANTARTPKRARPCVNSVKAVP